MPAAELPRDLRRAAPISLVSDMLRHTNVNKNVIVKIQAPLCLMNPVGARRGYVSELLLGYEHEPQSAAYPMDEQSDQKQYAMQTTSSA